MCCDVGCQMSFWVGFAFVKSHNSTPSCRCAPDTLPTGWVLDPNPRGRKKDCDRPEQSLAGGLWLLYVPKDLDDCRAVVAAHVSGDAVLWRRWNLVITALAVHLAPDLHDLLDAGGAHRMAK
jgi:hypothetical protein